jgi:hypothetical protein
VFNGTNQYLSNIGFSFNISQRSIFIVFQQLTYTLYTGVLPIIPSPTSGTDYQATTGMTIETSNGLLFYQNSGSYQNNITTTTPVALGIYYEQMSGTAGTTYRNGNFNSNATSGFTSGSCGGYAVGCRWSGAPTTPYLNGYMNEVIIFNSALTNTQRQNVEGYLAWKWNLQTSLPTTHPYYNNAYLSNSYPITYFPSRLNPSTTFPNEIPNLALWLDAADSSRMTVVGSNITQYIDKSPNQIVLSNATSANQPNLVLDSNNMPNMLFNGTSQHLVNSAVVASNLTLNNEVSIFFVHTPSNVTNSLICWTNFSISSGNPRINFHTPEGSTGFKFDYAASATGRLEVSVPNYLTSGRRLEGGFKRGTSQVIRTFGSTVASKVNSLTITGSTTLPLTLGWFFNLANYYYAGRFCELVWYNRGLDDSEIQQIEGYLAFKWKINNLVPPTPLTIRQYIWQPTGMALWLDASDKATITPSAGGTISAWLDKSGNNKNPTFEGTTTYNAVSNTVFTTGSSYFFSAVDTRKTTVANMTLFLVHRQTNNTNPTNQGLWGNDIGGGWNRFQLLNFVATPAQTYAISAGGAGIYYNVPNLNSLNRLLYTCQYSLSATNGSFVNINGTNSVTFTEIPAQTQTETQNTYFGTIDTGINGAVEFYEILLYTTSVSVGQRQQLEGYLAWKWGLQKSLPSSHPFFNFPPG